MNHATIKKWHISKSQAVRSYQLALEISVNDLTQESMETKSEHLMDIEILEDMYVARILGVEGQTYAAGDPIALFCEEKEEITKADDIDVSEC